MMRSLRNVLARRFFIFASALVALWAFSAQALELVGGNINTTAPGSSFNGQTFPAPLPWDAVGQLANGMSVIFLGDVAGDKKFWVLTAAHAAYELPAGAAFGGVSYKSASGSYRRLLNADRTATDLAMFRLEISAPPPGLSALALKATAPAAGEPLYYVGFGGGVKRWGFNEITGRTTFDDGAGLVIYLVTEYDSTPPPPPNPNETQANGGDSGGAAFTFNATTKAWELAGVMLMVRSPPPRTYSASAFDYRAQILETAAKRWWERLFLRNPVAP